MYNRGRIESERRTYFKHWHAHDIWGSMEVSFCEVGDFSAWLVFELEMTRLVKKPRNQQKTEGFSSCLPCVSIYASEQRIFQLTAF